MKAPIIAICTILAVAVSGCICPADGLRGWDCPRASGETVWEDRQLSGFEGIEASGNVDVVVSNGPVSVAVAADRNFNDYVEARVDGGRLILSWTPACADTVGRARVMVRVPEVKSLSAGNFAKFSSEGELSGEDLRLTAATSSRIDATVNVSRLYLSASNSGAIFVGGSAGELTAYSTNSGRISGYNLQAAKATVTADSGSTVEAYVRDELTARAETGARIFYKGQPKVARHVLTSAVVDAAG